MSRNGNELTAEEKELIRTEVNSVPDEEKTEKRKQLAAEYNVSLATISAISAWTVIRAKRSFEVSKKINNLEKEKRRVLIHKQIISQHLQLSSRSRPKDKIHYEILEIFKRIYETEEIKKMIDEVTQSKIQNDEIQILLKDEDAQPGERVNYDNESKNASRDWWLNLLWKHTKKMDKSKMNLLLLPGPECHELSSVISMGYPPDNLRCFNLGKDPGASAIFIRNCQQQGAYRWQLSDLNECLPRETERIHGGNLDFTGHYSEKNERILNYIPVPRNGRMFFSINLQSRREQPNITATYREVASTIKAGLESVLAIGSIANFLPKAAQKAIKAREDSSSYETSTARKNALEVLLEENLGLSREENWLCAKEMEGVVVASGRHPNFDTYDSYEKAKAIIEVISTFEDPLIKELEDALLTNTKLTKEEVMLLCSNLMNLTRKGCLNASTTIEHDTYEYLSPTGSPFINTFVVCENFHSEYKKMSQSIRFYLTCLKNYLIGIQKNNSQEVLEKIRTTNSGEVRYVAGGTFRIIRKRNECQIVFISSDPTLTVSIPLKQIIRDVNQMTHLMLTKFPLSRMADKLNIKIEGNPEILSCSNRPQPQRKPAHHIPHGRIINTEVRVGRNQPCPCGSGNKFKKCCGAKSASS